ncbi:MAG TPA: MauE/DoxX family redox-associated membrane protein [Thermoanaerobaculia bacterium]|nr:MauE/DoxX family redox-associated membrane protein [Thermoanaerobaculia bacterium]
MSPEDLTAPRPWKFWVGTAGGVLLAVVLLVAAWSKAIDPQAFARQIHQDSLDFLIPAAAVALIGLAIETAIGAALLCGLRRLWVLVPAAALVAFFLLLTGHTYWLAAHGQLPADASCGCFGNLLQRSPAQAFWQDTLLLVPSLLLAFVGRPHRRGLPRWRLLFAAIATLAGVVLAWSAPSLPLDNLATRLRPGVSAADLCVGGSGAGARVCLSDLVPELQTGRHVMVIANLADPGFGPRVAALNSYAERGEPLIVVTAASLDEQSAFTWKWGPRFPIKEAPGALLGMMYRSLPRSFEVDNGRVTKTWSGLPPGVHESAGTTS